MDVIRELEIDKLPPWYMVDVRFFEHWRNEFKKAEKTDFIPFARRANDDVIATFNIHDTTSKVYLFTIPLTSEMIFFKEYSDFILWFEDVTKEMIEYIKDYS